jgi:hypothetical protein
VPAGGFSFNEDGACINESKESLARVGDGVIVGDGVVAGEAAFFGTVSSAFAVGST